MNRARLPRCFAALLRGGVAVALLQAAVAESRDAARLLEEANSSYSQSRPADAVRLYREYLKSCPQRADVRVFLGAALLNLNQINDALREAQRALKLDGNLAKAYVLEGRVYSAQQQWDAAMASFEKAEGLQPLDPDAWYFAGRAAYDADRSAKALDYFRHALQLAPREWRIYEGLGLAHEALGQSCDAERAYRQAVEMENSSYQAALALGRFLFRQGHAAESLPYFETAMRLAPGSPDVRFEFGRTLYQMGRASEAKQVLENGLPTRDCRIYNLLAKILNQRGEAAAAGRQLDAWHRCSAGTN